MKPISTKKQSDRQVGPSKISKSRLSAVSMILFAAFCLAACGGGGGSSSGTGTATNTPTTTPTVTNQSSNVVLDTALPSAVKSSILSVISPSASATLGTSIQIPTYSDGSESTLLAVDASNNIILASMTTSSSATLSADSTALAFVRFALGSVPAGLTATQLN